ncbi:MULTISPECIES: DUF2891 domain-containing protein [Flavobacterium]|uniref:DUF2891 domain-containing protein n=1 Tax=Flavobacterium covae TaxID=2906076 RepID=A0ABW8PFA2_9FLAO|nr:MULTISPECIES: DUF2891 domain-containing protein [Flavobacterium]AMA50469.1 hypothetical protein AWN65_13880 [Flavobacterium covae]MCJ1809050.1 DUF2891 domain-containing protein [Flavobacterium covae]OWP82390.1 hypothetical protein BWK63_00815 [Flavobacterium covae]POR23201.1 hypothetical protein BWK57_03125 [Flavobacterium columnare]
MKYLGILLIFLIPFSLHSQEKLTQDLALKLSKMPLHCINTQFPNKTNHLSDSEKDALLLPKDLHPSFYGCLDWHSSVHGHWMLVKLLKDFPSIENKNEIINILNHSFQKDNIQIESEYFGKYTASKGFERTYGWAWLLKLDLELSTWNNDLGQKWHQELQPLTQKIVTLWKEYLPKQTYPNRTGVHPNTAFGLCFAYDWAHHNKEHAFLNLIIKKSNDFYLKNIQIPSHLEPDGSDFFSPSLQAADLMTRILSIKEYETWLAKYLTKQGIERLCQSPTVSDRNDYQIVHLDGLSFSRAWNMKKIAKKLPDNNKLKLRLNTTANQFINNSLKVIFDGGYGGEHWLASFAIYALSIE